MSDLRPVQLSPDEQELHLLRTAVWHEYERQRSAQRFMESEPGYSHLQVRAASEQADAFDALYLQLEQLWADMHPVDDEGAEVGR